jgi:hypothetical protein
MRLLNGVVEFLSLRIAWSFDAKQMGDCRSNMAYTERHRRITLFINLPFDTLSNMALKEKLDEIGRTR